ncbi:MAG: transglutaminase domain-containing protein [Clostridia bacterium]|nr:transglutaminase domain-containing protein [Clostridia bacterium]
MKKILRSALLVLGIVLLIAALAALVLMTALRPLTMEAGGTVPAAEAFCRYPFLRGGVSGDPADGSADPLIPGEYTVTLRVLGIPRTAVLAVVDTVPPRLTPISHSCFLGEEPSIDALVTVEDVTETKLSYVTPPDVSCAGTQTVEVCAVDAGGNRTTVEVALAVYSIAHDVEVEAGTSPRTVEKQIADAIDGEVTFGGAMDELDTSQIGEHEVHFLLDGREVDMTLTVVDTVSPIGSVRTAPALLGGTVHPEAFLDGVTDETEVSVEFADSPDFSQKGLCTVDILLTDAGGNTTVLQSSALVYGAPASCTLEMGTFTPESLRAILLAGEELTADEALLTDLRPGTFELPLTTVDGEVLTQTVTFTDSYPPIGEPQNRTAFAGQTLDAEAFVAYAADSTPLTYHFTDGKVPDFSAIGSHPVWITVTDQGGNSIELSAQLTVLPDTEGPVIYGVGDRVIYLGEGISYMKGVVARDNCDGEVSVKVDSSKVRPRQAGSYAVTYTAQDRAGNVTSRTVTFTIKAADLDALNERADSILASILRDGMTERQRARAIYDWVTRNMSYTAYADKTDYVAAAFYGFNNRRGDCFVYYSMSRVLLTRAGFENLEIHRNKPNQPHFWNLVKTEEGWYHFDTCPHYAAHPLDSFLLTDAQVKAYSENHVADYYSFDPALYPATP